MSVRWLMVIVAAVSLVHGWVLWGPVRWHSLVPTSDPAPASVLMAQWIAPPPTLTPTTAPPPTPAAKAPLRPAKTPRALPALVPKSIAPPVATPTAIDTRTANTTDSTAAIAADAPDTSQVDTANTEPAPASVSTANGPELRLHTGQGEALALHLPNTAEDLPVFADLRFQVHGWVDGLEYHAQAQLHWQSDGQQYQARQLIRAFLLGSLEQASQGTITAHGLQPHLFEDRRLFKHRQVQLDWQHMQAQFDPPRPSASIGTGAQDRLSVFLQLAALLQGLPALRTPGSRIEIPTLGSRNLQMWSFVVEAQESIDVPAGHFASLRLRRLPVAAHAEHAQLWLNPAQGYLPLRIQMQDSKGDVIDMRLQSP